RATFLRRRCRRRPPNGNEARAGGRACVAYHYDAPRWRTSKRGARMYAQMVDTGVAKVGDVADMSPEERAFQARGDVADMSPEERAFQARVDDDIRIEPKDWMPEAYRRTLIRQ